MRGRVLKGISVFYGRVMQIMIHFTPLCLAEREREGGTFLSLNLSPSFRVSHPKLSCDAVKITQLKCFMGLVTSSETDSRTN